MIISFFAEKTKTAFGYVFGPADFKLAVEITDEERKLNSDTTVLAIVPGTIRALNKGLRLAEHTFIAGLTAQRQLLLRVSPGAITGTTFLTSLGEDAG